MTALSMTMPACPSGAAPGLAPAFVDWWFAPWTDAAPDPWLDAGWPLAAVPPDPLARRDAYRLWCRHAGLAADIPRQADPGWQPLAGTGPGQLLATARLFGGLLATRGQAQALLAALTLDERRWCAAIAATQPLLRLLPVLPDSLELLGLAELAWRLEAGFAGLWPRLQLMLAPPVRRAVAGLLASGADPQLAATGAVRAQRCWTLCRQHGPGPGLAAAGLIMTDHQGE